MLTTAAEVGTLKQMIKPHFRRSSQLEAVFKPNVCL